MRLMRLPELPASVPVRTQIAVVGSGPAGAEVATYLAARGRHVTILESGTDRFDPDIQSLNDAAFAGRRHRVFDQETSDFHQYLAASYRGLNRVRELGGTSVIWTGKWRALQRRDLARRDWVPHSGWPIGFSDLDRVYAEIAKDYALGVGGHGRITPELRAASDGLRDAGFGIVPFFEHRAHYRSVERLRAATDTLSIVLDATVVRIDLADSGDRVAALTCRSIGGGERRVEAEHVVLAAGGLENPRLLLASNDQWVDGIGNAHDLVGRYYQDHLKVRGVLLPGPLARRHAGAFQTYPRPRVQLCLGLSDHCVDRHRMLDTNLYLKPKYEPWPQRWRNRALGQPMVRDGYGFISRYYIKLALEQAPNPDSRVKIQRERDALGVPRLEIDWRHTDLDRRSFDFAARELSALAKASGLGVIGQWWDVWGGWSTTPNNRSMSNPELPDPEFATDSAHHMGTTRMGATRREGVVDANCTVFDVPNLHIASSSVFPTCAAYSPTMTIVALARRLGHHLARLTQPGTVLTDDHPGSHTTDDRRELSTTV